jgi:hypothetical protein
MGWSRSTPRRCGIASLWGRWQSGRVWSRLIATSAGDLHVFLPLEDRGIDGIVHRISTDACAHLQVRGRTVNRYGGFGLEVRE